MKKIREMFKTKAGKLFWRIICAAVLVYLLCNGALALYASDSYKAEAAVETYLQSTELVKVSTLKNGRFFDGTGADTAIIFYPGAKVEYTAYAPLMLELAEAGVDCFMLEMPYNMAILDSNAAEDIIKNYSYEHWYLAGHSLGGVSASSYASKNMDSIAGVVLLASYPTSSLKGEDFSVISVYGSADGVLNHEKYAESLPYMPEDFTELRIEGGNHAGFGIYGEQAGDGAASITGEEQRRLTVEYILQAIDKE